MTTFARSAQAPESAHRWQCDACPEPLAVHRCDCGLHHPKLHPGHGGATLLCPQVPS